VHKPIADALWSHRIHASCVDSGIGPAITPEGSMNDESDLDLRPDQWETLKALRAPVATLPAARLSASGLTVLDDLVALGLVSISEHLPVITPKGRKALIRGSFRLLDAAA
jgi:hypothetical protein